MKTKMWLSIVILSFTFTLLNCSKQERKDSASEKGEVQQKSDMYRGNTSKILNVSGALTETEIPRFSWINEKNEEIKVENYKGKVIILNFWATWCGPCKKEIPDFIRIYNKYRAQGVEILGVSLDSGLDIDELAEFVGENEINYQIILDNGMLQSAYGEITAIPTTYIIGKDFKVKDHFVGALSEEQLEKILKSEL